MSTLSTIRYKYIPVIGVPADDFSTQRGGRLTNTDVWWHRYVTNMVKSTVRFPETVVEEVETLVEEGSFESKSEFYRFATDYILTQVVDGYTPKTIDFDEIESELLDNVGPAAEETEELPFFESAVIVRQYALRGKFSDAEDFIDHHYTAGNRHAMLLEELLNAYRQRPQVPDTPRTEQEMTAPDRSR